MIDNENLRLNVVKGLKSFLQIPVIRGNQNAEPPKYPYFSAPPQAERVTGPRAAVAESRPRSIPASPGSDSDAPDAAISSPGRLAIEA